MRRLSVPLLVTSLLIGCGQTASEPRLEAYCPPIPAYTAAYNEQLADDLEDAADTVIKAVSDYAALRDRLRNCQEIKENR